MEAIRVAEANHQSGFAPRRHYDTVNAINSNAIVSNVGPIVVPNGQGQPIEGIIGINNNINKPKVVAFPYGKKMTKIATTASKLSLEDSVKLTDVNGFAMKTPVSLLQEILSRRGITPNYELVQIEGAIHEPTFRYRVSFNDKDVPFTAMGAGRSKKEAKHSAARGLIDKLTGVQIVDSQANVLNNNINIQDGIVDPGANNAAGSGDGADKVVGNPIGWLQEMCMSRRWPPPTYETETEVGLPHERLFTIACTILNFREVGKGKSKKIAKRMAAHKMWTRLQETPLDNSQILETIRSELDSDKTCLVSTKIDYIKLLAEIAQENQFEVTYVDIEEKTFSGQYQCLVQISTLPVGVCHGSGPTPADAQKQAAQNALDYLKIMTKK
ncbi:interferon-inducible double-stranded RNA-dependent protein kinase activator A homolog isoform X2 [Glossina fuscipes]|uniref:Interferon-inducible double-stranded RNA-dependent protein kinase activator A homolog isoform X2 n=1 Tax=Glossina fuscipes TaxID=7396 RepID=A0A8U0WF57_9MUSC|nr:interferon-inducible double-stranded RNA-dependent protein kinase activator A homolog isoform X2 [Glossina fuscipes]